MPSGDAQRTWFPELVDVLRQEWSCPSTWGDLIHLRDGLDEALCRIRTERRIRSPMVLCHRCGKRHAAAPPRVSVRAVILAAHRFGLTSEEEAKALARDWRKYRAAHQLDLCGKASSAQVGAESAHERESDRAPRAGARLPHDPQGQTPD